jgi:hypothetical protein
MQRGKTEMTHQREARMDYREHLGKHGKKMANETESLCSFFLDGREDECIIIRVR